MNKKHLWSVCGKRFSAFPWEGVIGELRGVPAIESAVKMHIYQMPNIIFEYTEYMKYSGAPFPQEINKLNSLCLLCVFSFHSLSTQNRQNNQNRVICRIYDRIILLQN